MMKHILHITTNNSEHSCHILEHRDGAIKRDTCENRVLAISAISRKTLRFLRPIIRRLFFTVPSTHSITADKKMTRLVTISNKVRHPKLRSQN